jgi:hypothetical protein
MVAVPHPKPSADYCHVYLKHPVIPNKQTKVALVYIPHCDIKPNVTKLLPKYLTPCD